MNLPDMVVPAQWISAPLVAVCEKIQDGTHFSPKTQLTAGTYRYITAKNVRSTGLELDDVTFLRSEDHRAIFRRCDPRKGDVLLVKDGVNTGDVALNTLDDEISLLSSVCFLRPEATILSPAFLRYFLMSPAGQQALTGRMTGTAIRRIVLHRIKETRVPIAPRCQQDRIVEALDGYLSQLDAASRSLESAQRKLKAYRASVLKAAVEGRLVPTEAELARREGRSYEPADVLLLRILGERRRRWEEAELASVKAAGKTPKDDRWKAKYSEPEPPDVDKLPHLPDGWCWAPASSLYWDAGYGTSVKCTSDGKGPAVLRIPNIVAGNVDLDDLKFAADDAVIQADGRVRSGDFLFIRTNGSRALIGRGALVFHEAHAPLFFASYLIRLRLVTTDACDRWFALAWRGPSVRNQVLRVAASSAGQHNVSLSAVSSFAVPLPPAAEQARILAEFERLDSGAAVVEQDIAKAIGRSNRLTQTVLKWAFEGRLVDQDSADEPAESMLARIRAERSASAPTSSKSKRSRKLKAAS